MRRLGCFGLIALLAVLGAAMLAFQDWGGRGPLNRNTSFQVAEGASLAQTAERLEKAGAIRSAARFKLFARLFGASAPVKAGEYRIPARLSAADILKLLQGGKTLQRFVTIPEGLPSVLVRDRLMAAKELTGPVAVPVEGTVLPDSYSFQRGDTRQQVLDRMQNAMLLYLARAWEARKPGIAVSSPREALILASIVEKETGKPSERRLVAAVYSNRLKRSMMLQADPTTIYPITRGRPLGRRILRSELHAKNGYNTYAMTGLPAGPICNPGRASIDAVLDPEQSNALYFVADGTGGHVFADTLDQHNANVQKWYALRRARGEM
ncbi:endolytic transglycosylase MltG [Sphingomonas sp.]|uniref:endolytic transglycosylase MltG n=1 Tax=Sphingomonas sp. TaxID=28214 RepID=UPI001E1135DD|nr:endolytic transglycosylase MltG [Sphingomonas sp.]MBX9795646.1 endolytic transglycosylase MltG [Sphingomonas sp.]